MSVLCSEIIEYIEELAPVYLAEKWDNVGLMVGGRDKKVHRILLCLDVTSRVVMEAVNKKVDMIISHHPLIFDKLKSLTWDSPKGRVIRELIKNDISVYSAHTNLDVVDNGVNASLAAAIGLKQVRILKAYEHGESYLGKKLGLGLVGTIDEDMDLQTFITHIKNSLKVSNVRVVGKIEKIKSIAVFCGAFDDELDILKKEGIDVLVTGDLKYHTAQDAVEMGLCIVDAGHFATESPVLPKLKELLSNGFEELEIECNNMEADPFIFY